MPAEKRACLLPFSGPGLLCSHICIVIVTIRFCGAWPEEIVAAAAEQKMPAVALTDTNGLYTAVPFYKAAQAAGIKPIVGVVLDVAMTDKNHRPSAGNASFENVSLVLLAADMEGYSN